MAAEALQAGGVIAYPTEGVWGLGCNPFDYGAVERLMQIKQRSINKGVLLISGQQEHFSPLYEGFDAEELARLHAGWRKFQTWILPNRDFAPSWVTGDHSGIAVRVTKHPLVAALTKRFAGPIVSTSANLAGQAPIGDVAQLKDCLGEQLDYVLPGQLGGQQKASTIVDFVSGNIVRA